MVCVCDVGDIPLRVLAVVCLISMRASWIQGISLHIFSSCASLEHGPHASDVIRSGCVKSINTKLFQNRVNYESFCINPGMYIYLL